MRQAVIEAPEVVALREGELPEPGPGDVRVRPAAVGICGSDLHALEGAHPFIDLPVVPGHEVAGTVEAVGAAVQRWTPGDRVLLEPNLVCGRCLHCTSGRYNLCERLRVVGCQAAGAMADAFVSPADRFHRVSTGMTMAAAALVEPLSTGTHAVRIAGDLTGAAVAILGAGSIGLLTMLAARAAGADRIAVTDLSERKRARALELGASLAVDGRAADAVKTIRDGLPTRPDVVFDCVSTQSSIGQAVALALNGGTVVVVGVPRSAVEVPLPLVQDRELRIQGTAMYVEQDVLRAIELIERGRVPAEELITATFGLAEAPAAFRAARSGDQVKVQVVLD